jgi:3-hydroxyisobutyrate dehydrogenase and related beta-hydroxyacid dehydrogenases
MSDVTVIGLGDMGSALARTLLARGRRVTVWNRTPAKADPLVREGATLAPHVAAAVAASPVVIVCVANYTTTRALLDTEEASAALAAGRVLVELSTGTPQDARNAEAWAREQGADYLDGAILATPSQVGRPDTPIITSGSPTAFAKSEPLLRDLAGGLEYLGEPVGTAAAWDLAFNAHLFGGVIGLYHGARILESEGIPLDEFADRMAAIAPVIGEIVRHDGEAIHAGDFAHPDASLEMCWKGLSIIARQAAESGINAEFPQFAAALFQKGVAAGYGHEKAPALIKVLRATSA